MTEPPRKPPPEKEKIKCDRVEVYLEHGRGVVKIDGKELGEVVEVNVTGRAGEVTHVLLNVTPKEVLIRLGKGCEVVTQDDPKVAADVAAIPGGKGDSIATATER